MIREYDYDDVLLTPLTSNVNSREDVNFTFNFLGKKRYPIFSAPMKNVSEVEIIRLLDRLKCIGILHKFDTLENRLESVDILARDLEMFGVACGLNETDFAVEATKRGANFICIDIANGGIKALADMIKRLKDLGVNNIMSGNVATYSGVSQLVNAGSEFIRVGVGSGKVCWTRNVTGVGRPQLSALKECKGIYKYFPNTILISDGGISNSGNAVKSFAFGAKAVMLGSVLARAKELNNEYYYGMASKKLQKEFYGANKSVEGTVIPVTEHYPLSDIIDEFVYGVKSACTYLDCSDYKYIANNAIPIEVSRSAIKEL